MPRPGRDLEITHAPSPIMPPASSRSTPSRNSTSTDGQGAAEPVRGRLEDQHPRRHQAHALRIERVARRDLLGRGLAERLQGALQRAGLEHRPDHPAQRGRAAADGHRHVRARHVELPEDARRRAARPIARRSAADGGSVRRYSSARWPEPRRNEAHHGRRRARCRSRSRSSPTTSTTPIVPSSARPSVRVAPRKASRASSSPSRIVTSTAPRSPTTSTKARRGWPRSGSPRSRRCAPGSPRPPPRASRWRPRRRRPPRSSRAGSRPRAHALSDPREGRR